MSNVSLVLGRWFLGLYFVVPGLSKMANPAQTIAYIESHEIAYAAFFMWLSAIVNLVGGFLIISSRYVRMVAYGFILYVLLVNFMLHDFWTMGEDMVDRETQNFFKNLGIMAGLMVLAGAAPARRLSMKNWWQSDNVSAE